ncbi:uncharacterized protein TNCV_922711 [Trichonephila clavipes]|nr:uncharacterized protein TNCV_922711 [Trichonephila clavipes]
MNKRCSSRRKTTRKCCGIKFRTNFIGRGEDQKIDSGNELKNICMKNGETLGDYIARARGISTECHFLGLDVSPKELVYHTFRGLNGKFSKVRDILKTERGKKIENDNSIPLQTMSSPQAGKIQLPVLELNDVENQIPVRRSERLKSKMMSVYLTNNEPNFYFEAKKC